MKSKVGQPHGSGHARLIRSVIVNEFYLAVKELEHRGASFSELLAEQFVTDPLDTLTKVTAYLPVK